MGEPVRGSSGECGWGSSNRRCLPLLLLLFFAAAHDFSPALVTGPLCILPGLSRQPGFGGKGRWGVSPHGASPPAPNCVGISGAGTGSPGGQGPPTFSLGQTLFPSPRGPTPQPGQCRAWPGISGCCKEQRWTLHLPRVCVGGLRAPHGLCPHLWHSPPAWGRWRVCPSASSHSCPHSSP